MEGLGYVRINLDEEILLLGHLLVAELDVPLDPVRKVLANNGVGHAEDEILAEPIPLELQRWEVRLELRVLVDDLHDLSDGETLVGWAVDVPAVLLLQISL